MDSPNYERTIVVGAGYVGLVTGACLTSAGRPVTLVEIDEVRRRTLLDGHSPIYEPGLDELLQQSLANGMLTVSGDLAAALDHSRVVVLAVGTPSLPDGRADLSAIEAAIAGVRRHARPGTVLVIKSTVTPGTGFRMQNRLAKRNRDDDASDAGGDDTGFAIPVVSCPEFLREGSAIEDIWNATRVVVGGRDSEAVDRVARIMNVSHAEVVRTDNTSAELIKYGSNAFLAIKISFINEMANLCDLLDGNIDEVAHGMGLDDRIGRAFLNAGLGFGGSCFPKDVRALEHAASREGSSFWMLKTALEVNEQQRMRFVQKIRQAVGHHLHERRIAMLGLAFKPGTDDMRQAPSIAIGARLTELGATVVAHDPVAMEAARPYLEDMTVAVDPYAAAAGADALAIVTEWPEYRDLDWARVRSVMRQAVIIDGRNCLDPERMRDLGFNYHSIGRSPSISRWGRRAHDSRVGDGDAVAAEGSVA